MAVQDVNQSRHVLVFAVTVTCMHLVCRLLCSSQASLVRSQLPSLYRAIQTSAALAGDVKIEVPSMGDSISEGTVASVAKQAGQHTISKQQYVRARPC